MFDPANPLHLMAIAVAIYVGSAGLALLLSRRMLIAIYAICCVAAVIGIAADLNVLLSGAVNSAQLPLGLPTIGLRFRLDPLSAFFGVVVNLGVLAASLYGLGLDRKHDLSPRVEPYFPAFAAAMNGVLLANDAFAFLFCWELMSLTSWAIVVSRHDDASRAVPDTSI